MAGKAITLAEFERLMEAVMDCHGTPDLSTVDLVKTMDAVISACRAITVLRLEQEEVPYCQSLTVARAFDSVEDPGLASINQSILAIAARAGLEP